MARLIEEFGTVRCVAAEPVNEEKELEWGIWRKDFVGREGWLNFCISEHKYPGKEFFFFFGGEESDKEWSLKSFVKQKDESKDKMVLITENSRYEFEILHKYKE